jgi:hypothetical protein
MPDSLLHDWSDFKALGETAADSEKINDPLARKIRRDISRLKRG